MLHLLCMLCVGAALLFAGGGTDALQTEHHRQRRFHHRRHDDLVRELDETTSPTRRQALEQEIVDAKKQRNTFKYLTKGHTETAATKIVDLEHRLHGLQQDRAEPTSDADKADRLLEMKALRADIARLKFPPEDKKSGAPDAAAAAQDIKEQRAQAKALRSQIRSVSDPMEKQQLRAQLDKLYA
jgi:hypothetical protein